VSGKERTMALSDEEKECLLGWAKLSCKFIKEKR
jgi:hypothetical protein